MLKFAEIINDLTMKSLSKYIMCVAGASILFSCNNKPEWKVDGRIEGADGQTILLDNLPDGPTKQYAIRVKRDFAIYRRLYYDALEDDA